MNKKYMFTKKKVIVFDENDNDRIVDYHDNIQEVLKYENIIELIENEIEFHELGVQNYEQHSLSYFLDTLLTPIPGIASIAAPLYLMQDEKNRTGNPYLDALIISAVATVGGCISYALLKDKLRDWDNYWGSANVVEQLYKLRYELLEDLVLLQANPPKELIDSQDLYTIQELDDEKEQERLRQRIDFHFDCGYNGKRYYKYYKRHKELPETVKDTYTLRGQNMLVEYLEEKAPELVKRRKVN